MLLDLSHVFWVFRRLKTSLEETCWLKLLELKFNLLLEKLWRQIVIFGLCGFFYWLEWQNLSTGIALGISLLIKLSLDTFLLISFLVNHNSSCIFLPFTTRTYLSSPPPKTKLPPSNLIPSSIGKDGHNNKLNHTQPYNLLSKDTAKIFHSNQRIIYTIQLKRAYPLSIIKTLLENSCKYDQDPKYHCISFRRKRTSITLVLIPSYFTP